MHNKVIVGINAIITCPALITIIIIITIIMKGKKSETKITYY